MTDESQSCPDCGASYDLDDNYCRKCGMYVAALRPLPVPAAIHSRSLEPRRAGLPAPVAKAATAVAIGAALQIGVGLAGRYLAKQAARQAVAAVRPGGKRRSVERSAEADPAPPAKPVDYANGATAVSETLLIRRVWIRHD